MCSIVLSLRALYQAGLVGHCILEVVACSDGGVKDSPVNSGDCIKHLHTLLSHVTFSFDLSVENKCMAKSLSVEVIMDNSDFNPRTMLMENDN